MLAPKKVKRQAKICKCTRKRPTLTEKANGWTGEEEEEEEHVATRADSWGAAAWSRCRVALSDMYGAAYLDGYLRGF